MFTTTPGFSSRSDDAHVQQLPMRDEAVMEEQKPGFSNSKTVSGEAETVQAHDYEPGWSSGEAPPEPAKALEQSHNYEPGWSSGASEEPAKQEAVKTVSEAETKVVEPEQTENKAVQPAKKAAKRAPAKRAAKKTAAKKG